MSVSWFLLVHTCFTDDAMYVLTNYKQKLLLLLLLLLLVLKSETRKTRKTLATLFKKKTLAQVFSCEFFGIFKNTYFYRRPLVANPIEGYITI